METTIARLEQEANFLHSHVCQGLGDPKRILILYLLAEGPRNVTEVTEALGVPQPTASHHLKILRDRGLVEVSKEGTANYYSLTDRRVIQALDLLRAVMVDILIHQAELVDQTSE